MLFKLLEAESCYLLQVYTLRHSLTLSTCSRRHSRGAFNPSSFEDARLGKRGGGGSTVAGRLGRIEGSSSLDPSFVLLHLIFHGRVS
jgi:hypothetical protein